MGIKRIVVIPQDGVNTIGCSDFGKHTLKTIQFLRLPVHQIARKNNHIRVLVIDQIRDALHFNFMSTTEGSDMEVGELHNLLAIKRGRQIEESYCLLMHLITKTPQIVAIAPQENEE